MADFRLSKLDFANPLEPNANDISLDYNDLIDPISALISTNEAMDVFTRSNVFEGVDEYVGLIIQVSTEEQYKPPGLFDLVQGTFGAETRTAYFKAHIPTLHASIGSPCDIGYLNRFGTPKEKVAAALKRIQNHPWFFATYTANLFTNKAPGFGDIVKIKFLKNPSSGKMIQGEIAEIVSRGNDESLDDLCQQSNKDLFGGYSPNYGNPLLSLLQGFTNAPYSGVKDDPTFVSCRASSYPNLPKQPTKFFALSPEERIQAIKNVGGSYPLFIKLQALSITLLEQPNNGPNYNYAGVQLDSGEWPPSASQYINYQTCYHDDKEWRIFAGFNSSDDFFKFFLEVMYSRYQKGQYKAPSGDSNDAIAGTITDNWLRKWNLSLDQSELDQIKSKGFFIRKGKRYDKDYGKYKNTFLGFVNKYRSNF